MAAAAQTPRPIRKHEVAKLAEKGERFEILKNVMPRVRLGTIWFSDTTKIGPANAEKCQVPISTWTKAMKAKTAQGRCKGLFLSSFGRNHASRRCEKVSSSTPLCQTCWAMWSSAKETKAKVVSVKGQKEYEVISKALFSRQGVVDNMAFWDDSSKNEREGKNLNKKYPYFSATEMIEMVFLDSKTIFQGGGKGGRTYARSAMVVEAQDEFMKECMTNILSILRYEQKDQFIRR